MMTKFHCDWSNWQWLEIQPLEFKSWDFCTGEINPFSFAEQIVQPGKCGTYCWRIILGDFLQRQYHTFCPSATLLLSTRETGQLFFAFCKVQYLSERRAHLPIPYITSLVALTPPKMLSIRGSVVCFWHSLQHFYASQNRSFKHCKNVPANSSNIILLCFTVLQQ